jgi:hypothetical protein
LACDGCGKSLDANFTEFDDQRLCDDCVNSKFVCGICNKHVDGAYVDLEEGKIAHVDCVEEEEVYYFFFKLLYLSVFFVIY